MNANLIAEVHAKKQGTNLLDAADMANKDLRQSLFYVTTALHCLNINTVIILLTKETEVYISCNSFNNAPY